MKPKRSSVTPFSPRRFPPRTRRRSPVRWSLPKSTVRSVTACRGSAVIARNLPRAKSMATPCPWHSASRRPFCASTRRTGLPFPRWNSQSKKSPPRRLKPESLLPQSPARTIADRRARMLKNSPSAAASRCCLPTRPRPWRHGAATHPFLARTPSPLAHRKRGKRPL